MNQDVYKVVSYKSLAGSDPAHLIDTQKSDDAIAIYVTTGAPVPDGFNAVVPIENIEKLDNMQIRIEGEVTEGQYIRLPGSDIKAGQLVIEPH